MVQARLGSKRFPKKVLSKVGKNRMIDIQFKRLKKVKSKKKIVYLIPNNKKNKTLKNHLKKKNIFYFQGNENNVLKRYFDAAVKLKAKKIIRITADCPLIDYRLIDKMIKIFDKDKFDYASNTIKRSFAHGQDMEIFTFKTLKSIKEKAKSKYDKEHVTSFIKSNAKKFKIKHFCKLPNESKFRITVDYKEDLELIRKIISFYKNNIFILSNQIIECLKKNKNIHKINLMHNIY